MVSANIEDAALKGWTTNLPPPNEKRERPVVGLMMSRNEVDIIAEVLESWRRFDVPIIALDDSDDGTYEILRASKHVTVLRQRAIYPRAEHGPLDWMHQALLEEKRKRFGVDTWVMLALADELWLHHPRKIAAAMQERAAACCPHCRYSPASH